MIRRDKKIKAVDDPKEVIAAALALFLALALLAGCESLIVEIPAPKQFDCTPTTPEWYCRSRATDKCIKNTYTGIEECESAGLIQYNGTE